MTPSSSSTGPEKAPDRALGESARSVVRFAFFWTLPFLAALLPIVVLSVFSYRIAAGSVLSLVETSNLSAASNLSQQMNSDLQQALNITSAFASLPGTVDAVREMDAKAVRTRLKPLVLSSPSVNRAFVTTTGGILWSDYPPAVDVVGSNLSSAVWFELVSAERRPIISTAYVRDQDPPQVVVAVVAPVIAEEDQVMGIMVLEYFLSFLSKQLQNIKLADSGYLYVLDSRGMLVAHPSYEREDELYGGYKEIMAVQSAIAGSLRTEEYEDPLLERRMLATFFPVSVGEQKWVVVANQPVEEAYAPLLNVKMRIALAGGFLTLITSVMVISLAWTRVRNERLNRALRKLASIVEHSNDAIIGISLNGSISTWNIAASHLLGYTAHEVKGKSLSFVSSDQELTVRDLLARVERGSSVEHVESVWTRKSGGDIPVSLTISPVRDDDGTMIGGSVIAQDISERKHIEVMKDNFISFVSHQLKAPVAAIRWHMDLIIEEAKKQNYSDYVQELLQGVYDINAQDHLLISDLLNVSLINRGVIQMYVKNVPLKEVVEMALQNYRQPIKEKNLELIVEDKEDSLMVKADKFKMAEAVANSVSNAIKHTENGSITVRISSKDKHGIVEVTDTGAGMSEDVLKKLFTRNQLLGSSTKSEVSAGLGLYIAKNFMTLQDGDVTVQSELGRGTTFTYWIPLVNGGKTGH